MEDGAATNGGSATSDEEAATNGGSATSDEETDRRPSLNSLALMRKATTPYNILSMDIKDWHCVVFQGVLLKNDTQKFWVHEKLHKNCFLVFPEACDIAGGNEESCWYWTTVEEKCFNSNVRIRVPESKLSWLLIQGRFETRALSPNTTYEVAFVVKLNGPDSEWPSELIYELHLQGGTKRRVIQDLTGAPRAPREKWRNLCADEFVMGPKTVGTISFTLRGTLDPQKTGLILKGVLIHPKEFI